MIHSVVQQLLFERFQDFGFGSSSWGRSSRSAAFTATAPDNSVFDPKSVDAALADSANDRIAADTATLSGAAISLHSGELEVRTARSRDDLESAFALLQRCYEAAGLSQSGKTSLRIMPHHLSATSQVFVALLAGQVVGTVTLVSDAIDGLPIARSYPKMISGLRNRSRQLGEITSLAVAPSSTIARGETFIQLTRLLTFFARARGIDYLTAITHPRHAKFYQNAMGFEVIGKEIPCETVGGNPGVAALGSVNDPSNYRPRWQNYYFEGDFTPADLKPHPISGRDSEYFLSEFDLTVPNQTNGYETFNLQSRRVPTMHAKIA